MAEPPVAAGGAHLAVASIGPPAVPATAVPMTGAPGTVPGVTATDRAENAPVPAALVAATVTVYPVMAEPPLSAGGVQRTVAEALPAVAATPLGAPGAVAVAVGVTAVEGAEGGLVPATLVAVTVKV